MSDLDIQIVDSLTVNLNQEEYSTEGQIQNAIDVYVEDEQQLFEAALTQDSINLYTRETPDIISFDTKGIMDGISKLESQIQKTSKEATLIAKVAELKEALNSIDFTAIEQAIQGVEDVTAKEATLIQGVEDIIKAVENIDFTDLETAIGEVKDAVANIDFSALAQEATLTQGIQAVKDAIDAIPATDLTPVAKETTLNSAKEEILTAVDNAKPEIDTTELAKQGENPNATLTAIYKLLIGSNEPSPDIPEGVAERLALILEFFGMKPIEAYEFMTPEEVCSELEDIMTTMDISLTQQQAQEITNNTLTN